MYRMPEVVLNTLPTYFTSDSPHTEYTQTTIQYANSTSPLLPLHVTGCVWTM